MSSFLFFFLSHTLFLHIQIFLFSLSLSSLHMPSFTSSRCMMHCFDEYECQYFVLSLQFYSSDSSVPLTSSSVLYSLFSLPDILLFLHLIPSLLSSVHHTTNILSLSLSFILSFSFSHSFILFLFLSLLSSSTHSVCYIFIVC